MNTETWKKIFLEAPSFDKTKSYEALKKMALSPLDLTKDGVITPLRLQEMQAMGAGFTLLYGCERVTDTVMRALFQLATERHAMEQMKAMQDGEIVNFIEGHPSERRAALHTAMRDIFDQKIESKIAGEARSRVLEEHEKLKAFINKLDSEKRFSEMIFIGIGGSELGPKALFHALSFYQRKDRHIHFICNIDPDDVAQVIAKANLMKSLVVVISKSGTTLETATNEEFVRAEFAKKGIDAKEHFVAITMPQTPMDDTNRYKEVFHVWDYVGGRYSATSMVGGLLLSFGVGYHEYLELLRGAHEMDLVALRDDPKENLPLLAALLGIWNRNFCGYATVAVIPYSQLLNRFPAHLQQCDMESNGKRIDRRGNAVTFETGPVVWGEPGTNAQHSFYQLIHQGTSTVPLEFIGFVQPQGNLDFEWKGTTSQDKLLSNLLAQTLALALGQQNSNPNKVFPGNRPNSLLMAEKLTPYALGALLSYYENKIAFQGFIWGVNSFDQEGVQLGKVLADRLIAMCAAMRVHKAVEPFPLGEALLDITKNIGRKVKV